MNRKILIVALFAITVLACNNTQKTTSKVYDVTQLLAVAENKIDTEVEITGRVNHVCSHSGRRCFLIDSTGDFSIRVEAGGQIESFSKEIIGSEIKVKGILKEEQLTADEITEWENELKEKDVQSAENQGETCSAEMANINNMRQWMKDHNKNYYAIYYIDGIQYALVE
jgi:hypothetical protein